MKQHTKRYLASENKILKAVKVELVRTEGLGRIPISTIARRAKLTRIGVYYHYPNIEAIYRENEEKILRVVGEIAEGSRVRKDDKRTFLRHFLIGVSRNSIRFEIKQNRGSYLIWTRILSEIKDLLTQSWTSYGKATDERIFRRYSAEFIGIMHEWGESRFDTKSMEKCLRQLVRLTEIAVRREREL